MALPVEPHVWLIASFIGLTLDCITVISHIHAQVLRMLHGWFLLLSNERIQGGEKQFAIMAIDPINTQSQGQVTAIT
ncbi:hypothetical protein KDA_73870 [Dictyobacter alpinus]|uniref:Uncharacterized protein n=1 Tax=Dictyobacter alpinus TaxID=2014873 RepID=A0A402BKL2_9CHLR|nr:hypothetical protein KDA_73870 [Dictyobacter alpinus]